MIRVVAAIGLVACAAPDRLPTGATCAPDSTLTYDTFGAPFMAAYCTRCHSSALPPDRRHGAPSLHDFDSLGGITYVAAHIDETSAAGPHAINLAMPPDDPRPTLAERSQLGVWIACGTP